MIKLREKVAAVQHWIWSHWMKYMFTQGAINEAGDWVMPAEKVKRWTRQMNTPYADLTEREKASDRDMADRVFKVVNEHLIDTAVEDSCLRCIRNGR